VALIHDSEKCRKISYEFICEKFEARLFENLGDLITKNSLEAKDSIRDPGT